MSHMSKFWVVALNMKGRYATAITVWTVCVLSNCVPFLELLCSLCGRHITVTSLEPALNVLQSHHGHMPKDVVKILFHRILPGSRAVWRADLTPWWAPDGDILAGFLWGICWPGKMKGFTRVTTRARTGCCCLCHQGRWWWRQQVALKCWNTSARSHYVTSQK